MLVINTIMIGIRNGTSMPCYGAGLQRAGIFVIWNAVLVTILYDFGDWGLPF